MRTTAPAFSQLASNGWVMHGLLAIDRLLFAAGVLGQSPLRLVPRLYGRDDSRDVRARDRRDIVRVGRRREPADNLDGRQRARGKVRHESLYAVPCGGASGPPRTTCTMRESTAPQDPRRSSTSISPYPTTSTPGSLSHPWRLTAIWSRIVSALAQTWSAQTRTSLFLDRDPREESDDPRWLVGESRCS